MAFKEILLFHYHLRKGGVTDVVVLALNAMFKYMKESFSVTILCGNDSNINNVKKRLSDDARNRVNFIIKKELDYEEKINPMPSPKELYQDLKEQYGGPDKLWWVHNYHLGKNTCFTEALLLASDDEQPLLLQIHDFPECARYENLQKLKQNITRDIYPRGKNVRYALINKRDYNLLIKAGIEKSKVFLLDNPVPLSPIKVGDSSAIKQEMYRLWADEFPAFDPEAALALYPVRAIRRKNILEAGLLVNLLSCKTNLVVTLPGLSDAEVNYSRQVEEAFKTGLIPGMCGVGMKEETELANYSNFWVAADMLISSSIQEGFGYLYINSLHWQKPLVTRYLDIMDGFLHLFDDSYSCIYQQVLVPLRAEQKKSLISEYRLKLDSLEKYIDKERGEKIYDQLVSRIEENKLGFSYFSFELQIEILKQIKESPEFRNQVKRLNKTIVEKMEQVLDHSVPSKDKEINATFGEENYTKTLTTIIKSFDQEIPDSRKKNSVQESLIDSFTELPYVRLLY